MLFGMLYVTNERGFEKQLPGISLRQTKHGTGTICNRDKTRVVTSGCVVFLLNVRVLFDIQKVKLFTQLFTGCTATFGCRLWWKLRSVPNPV